MNRFFMAAFAVSLLIASTPVEAKTKHFPLNHIQKHYARHSPTIGATAVILDIASLPAYPVEMTRQGLRARTGPMGRGHLAPSGPSEIVYIPTPPGAWRVAQSCAQRLAAYWGLGKGLDKVSTWPHVFAKAFGPGVGIAAVRRDQHHIVGIIGGGLGAWRVADFNSGGHLNREYTVSGFPGYFFVDPRMRIASR